MAEWYWYVGYVAFCLIVFFYLATRKKYRDPSAAQNYEKVRNKLTVRKLDKPKLKEEDSGFGGFSIANLISLFIVILVGVSLIGPISTEVNTAINQTTMNSNSSEFAGSILKMVPAFFAIMILGIAIAMIYSAFRRGGIV